MVDDVLEFVLVAEFSHSKLQTAQVDDGSHGDVVVVAAWPLVVETTCAERSGVSAMENLRAAGAPTTCERNSSCDSAMTGFQRRS